MFDRKRCFSPRLIEVRSQKFHSPRICSPVIMTLNRFFYIYTQFAKALQSMLQNKSYLAHQLQWRKELDHRCHFLIILEQEHIQTANLILYWKKFYLEQVQLYSLTKQTSHTHLLCSALSGLSFHLIQCHDHLILHNVSLCNAYWEFHGGHF